MGIDKTESTRLKNERVGLDCSQSKKATEKIIMPTAYLTFFVQVKPMVINSEERILKDKIVKILEKQFGEEYQGCAFSILEDTAEEIVKATNDSTAIELLRRCQDVLLLDINKNAMTSLKKEIAEYLVDL